MYPTQLHSYLLWRSTVEPTARQLAYKRFISACSLLPAAVCGLYAFGWYAGLVMAVCLASAFAADFVCRRFIYHREPAFTLHRDGTALLTGALVAMMVPPSIPLPLAAAGAVIGVLAGKYLLQADAMPLLQPALIGVVALNIICPILAAANPDPTALNRMNPRGHWPVLERGDVLESDASSSILPTPLKHFFGGDIRHSTSRTHYAEELLSNQPLAHSAVHGPRPQDLVAAAPTRDFSAVRPTQSDGKPAESYDWVRLILGGVPGTIGASSGLALLLGIAFLLFTRTLSFALPLTAFLTLTFGLCIAAWSDALAWGNVPIHLLSGGTLLTFFYFASDPTVAPRAIQGRIYAGVVVGLLELALRVLFHFSDGLLLSVLVMQGLAFVFDQYLAPLPLTTASAVRMGITQSSIKRL